MWISLCGFLWTLYVTLCVHGEFLCYLAKLCAHLCHRRLHCLSTLRRSSLHPSLLPSWSLSTRGGASGSWALSLMPSTRRLRGTSPCQTSLVRHQTPQSEMWRITRGGNWPPAQPRKRKKAFMMSLRVARVLVVVTSIPPYLVPMNLVLKARNQAVKVWLLLLFHYGRVLS